MIKRNTYFGLVWGSAIVTAGILYYLGRGVHPSTSDVIGAAMLMGVAYASDVLAFSFGNNEVKFSTSIAQLPYLACIILFPPLVAVVGVTAAVIGSNTFPNRRKPSAFAFNVSQAVLATAATGYLYHTLNKTNQFGSVKYLPAFIVSAILFSLMNIALVSGALASIRQQKFQVVFSEVVGQKGSNLVYGLMSSPIALIIVLLYVKYEAVGIIVVLLPLLLVRNWFANNIALQKANKDLLRVLIKAIETRDPYTSGHSLRVATLAVAIAEDLGLPPKRIDEVETAALLHDVGKIDPAFSNVIRKPYDLSPEERALIQTHAALGADLLQNLKSVKSQIVEAVRHHHERMDGKGYPSGLAGTAIPLAARIIMLCDSIDAMLSDRPYRKALPLDRVRQELVRCSGDQFDPDIVKVILQKDTLAKASQLVDTVSGFEDEYLIRAHA